MRNRILAAVIAVPLVAGAAPKNAMAPVRAVPAFPAQPTGASKPAEPLITSDLDGRDLLFITQAMEQEKALRYLAGQTRRGADPKLCGVGDELSRRLAPHSAVLSTVAEMKQVMVPDEQGETGRRMVEKCGKLDGAKLDKALLDGFTEIDRELLTICQVGATSKDPTIRKLAEQTIPQIREALIGVQTGAGIASGAKPVASSGTTPEPLPPPLTEAPPQPSAASLPMNPKPIAATETIAPKPLATATPARPGFRTNVRLPSDTAPTSGR